VIIILLLTVLFINIQLLRRTYKIALRPTFSYDFCRPTVREILTVLVVTTGDHGSTLSTLALWVLFVGNLQLKHCFIFFKLCLLDSQWLLFIQIKVYYFG